MEAPDRGFCLCLPGVKKTTKKHPNAVTANVYAERGGKYIIHQGKLNVSFYSLLCVRAPSMRFIQALFCVQRPRNGLIKVQFHQNV